jgi:hypothetical protein
MSNRISKRNPNTLNIAPPALSNISAMLYSNSGLVPLADREYTLQLGDGKKLHGKTDAEGFLQHLDVPAGDYDLAIDGVKWVVPTVANPEERLPIRVSNYYLIPGNEEEGEDEAEGGFEDEGCAVIPVESRIVFDKDGYGVIGLRDHSVEDEGGFDIDSEEDEEEEED